MSQLSSIATRQLVRAAFFNNKVFELFGGHFDTIYEVFNIGYTGESWIGIACDFNQSSNLGIGHRLVAPFGEAGCRDQGSQFKLSCESEGNIQGATRAVFVGGDWAGEISEVTDELSIFADSTDVGLVAFVEGTYHLGGDFTAFKARSFGECSFIKGGFLFADVETWNSAVDLPAPLPWGLESDWLLAHLSQALCAGGHKDRKADDEGSKVVWSSLCCERKFPHFFTPFCSL